MIFSQVTEKGINEICHNYIDESLTEGTDCHSLRFSGDLDDERKQFEINFSSYQLIGDKNLESKSRLQMEIFDFKNEKIVARSCTFMLKDMVKTISSQETLRKTAHLSLNIKMNNLVSNMMSM